jgi:phage/plasmid-like protein (TIGR03299 family)
MSHEIGSLDIVGLKDQQAWHGLGVVIGDSLSAEAAASRFGLTYQIGQWKLTAHGPNGESLDVSTHVANVRPSDNGAFDARHLLGVVGADYRVCQNLELAQFTDALAQTGQVTIESCGSIRNGKRVWFLAKGDAFTVGGSDTVFPYVLVSNGHDGTQAIRVTPTTVRVVCSNTLHMVIPNGEDQFARPETAAITIRHSGVLSDKLEQAKRALAYYGATLRRNQDLFAAMQAKRIDQAQAMALFADSYASFWEVATPEELNNADAKIRRTAELRAERMRKASDAFLTRWTDEQSKTGIGSTVWSAFNAMTGFVQHDKSARGENDTARVESRRDSNLFGINSNRTHEVLSASLAMIGG